MKQVKSWVGLYKTLIKHLPNLASFMSPFDSALGGKNSKEKFDWMEPGLVDAFNSAINQLDKVNSTVLPSPNEKLTLMPDTSTSNNCTGWVLYTERDGNLLPVQYASAKLKSYMGSWYPCEAEAAGVALAVEQVRHWINESKYPTKVLPDSKPVVDCANLMKRGKASKNARLQSLLNCINRSNIIFYHSSAKSGHHIIPDNISRTVKQCGSNNCQVERFLNEIPVTTQFMKCEVYNQRNLTNLIFGDLSSSAMAANISPSEILASHSKPIPLGSKQTWKEIQDSDFHCIKFRDFFKHGKLPEKKDVEKLCL